MSRNVFADVQRFIASAQCSEDDAWLAGYSAAKNGATAENCHFRFFTSPEKTAAWERGQKAANWERNNAGQHRPAKKRRKKTNAIHPKIPPQGNPQGGGTCL